MPSARPDRRRRRLLEAFVVSLLAAVPAVLLSQQASPPADTKLANVLRDLSHSVPQEYGAAPAGRKLAAPVAAAPGSLPASVRDAMLARHLRINDQNEVQVYIVMQEVTDQNLQQLAANAVTVEIGAPALKRVQARVPVSRLQAVAALPFVEFIRLPTYARRRIGAAITEGDAILHSDSVRSQLGLDGTGVKVGVLSDGLKGLFAGNCTTCTGVSGGPIATGDLPSATGTRSNSGVLTASSGGISGRSFQANGDLEGLPPPSPACAFPGAGAEGTALLEIVHDVAPGAQLSFANADTDLAFMQAVNFLAASNDVVVDDIGFFGDAYDGTSAVSSNTAAALNNPANRIRTYVTAVGNDADEHYIGTYADSGVDGTSVSGIATPGRLHLFQQTADTTDVLGLGPQPFNLISLPRNAEAVIFLTWDDPFGASANNYDLYLVQQSTGKVVASSTTVQNGHRDPVEFIDYVNTGTIDSFRILIQNVGDQAAPRQLNLYSFGPECAPAGPDLLANNHHERHNFNTASRSISAQGDAGGSPVSVISVGAICSASAAASSVFTGSRAPDESCNDRSNRTIEFFSSVGPTIDGRVKPDIAAIDGVSITGSGGFGTPFFGTSAAAPHVAGIAALLLQASPCLVSGAAGAVDTATARTRLRDLIVGSSTPLSGTVPDNVFGYGRADAFASAQRTLPSFTGQSAVVVSGNSPLGASVSPSQLGFSDPGQCPLTRLSWTGGCGTSPAAALTCPFGTTTVSVSASNNGVSFSNSASVQVTVTNFAVSAAPSSTTVGAGQPATYQVAIAPQGGAFGSDVTLGCSNLPAGTACSFTPPVVTPGSGGAQSVLTISTTARATTRPVPGRVGRGTHPAAIAWPQASLATSMSVLLALGSWLAGRRRTPGRRVRAAAAAGILTLAALSFQSACGGGGGTTPLPAPNPTAPSVTLSPTSLTFGAQSVGSASAPQTITLTSSGTAVLTITGIAATGDFAQSNTCGSSLAAGSSCPISVTFTPSATGQRTGALTVSDNASGSPHTVGLTGTGGSQSGGTPAGTYTIGVTGAAGTLVQSATVTLVVQ